MLLRVERVQAVEEGEELGLGGVAKGWLGDVAGWELFGFDEGHGAGVVVGHGVVVDAGVDEGGVEVVVAEQLLDGGDGATSVEQLGGVGVAQLVGCDVNARALSGGSQPFADKIFAQGAVAKEAEMVAGCFTSHGQIAIEGSQGGVGEVDDAVF